MRKRITYANVAATLALVFSMSGGALAATHYLISSTKQISPKVLKKLKGNAGKAGKAGAQGVSGAQGKEGAKGETGKEGAKGETGKEGPSAAYEAQSEGETEVTSTADELSLALPPGSYDITGTTEEQNQDEAHTGLLKCELATTKTSLDFVYVNAPAKNLAAGGYGDSIAEVHGGLTLTSPETVTMSCIEGGGESTALFVNNPRLSAIKVAALH